MDVLSHRFSQKLHTDLEGREKEDKIDWCNEMDKQFEKITNHSSHTAPEWAEGKSDAEVQRVLLEAISAVVKEHKLNPVIISEADVKMKQRLPEIPITEKSRMTGEQMFRSEKTETGKKKTYIVKRRE